MIGWEAMSRLSVYRLGIIEMQEQQIKVMEVQLLAKDAIIEETGGKVTALEGGMERANRKISDCDEDRRGCEKKLGRRGKLTIFFGSLSASLAAALAIVVGVK
jgi:hypothetical protein